MCQVPHWALRANPDRQGLPPGSHNLAGERDGRPISRQEIISHHGNCIYSQICNWAVNMNELKVWSSRRASGPGTCQWPNETKLLSPWNLRAKTVPPSWIPEQGGRQHRESQAFLCWAIPEAATRFKSFSRGRRAGTGEAGTPLCDVTGAGGGKGSGWKCLSSAVLGSLARLEISEPKVPTRGLP